MEKTVRKTVSFVSIILKYNNDCLKRKGIFITFEGPEGSGKSTHLKGLASHLQNHGHKVVVTREPGGTSLSTSFRQILLETGEDLKSLAELFLYEADRAQHVEEVVLPALKNGFIVLCDRYTDSTVAYQGYGRGLEMKTIRNLNDVASQGTVPDLTLLLDVPVERGLRQARNFKNRHDRLERAGLAFHKRVRAGFLKLAKQEPKRFRIVSQQENPEDTQALVRNAVDRFLSNHAS